MVGRVREDEREKIREAWSVMGPTETCQEGKGVHDALGGEPGWKEHLKNWGVIINKVIIKET